MLKTSNHEIRKGLYDEMAAKNNYKEIVHHQCAIIALQQCNKHEFMDSCCHV